MTKLDQFESVFRSAARETYRYEPIVMDSVVVVTDAEGGERETLVQELRKLVEPATSSDWQLHLVDPRPIGPVAKVLETIESYSPQLVCTYRHVGETYQSLPYSLGVLLDTFTQAVRVPTLVLPHPSQQQRSLPKSGACEVMVVTDHLHGDHRLVNFGVAFVGAPAGTLYLTHVESLGTFERYLEAIGCIPAIDTDLVEQRLRAQLLKVPRDYIASCKAVLEAAGVTLKVEPVVRMGHRLGEYRRLVEARDIDLLVLNTKDPSQQAMCQYAYPLAVELRELPLLML